MCDLMWADPLDEADSSQWGQYALAAQQAQGGEYMFRAPGTQAPSSPQSSPALLPLSAPLRCEPDQKEEAQAAGVDTQRGPRLFGGFQSQAGG